MFILILIFMQGASASSEIATLGEVSRSSARQNQGQMQPHHHGTSSSSLVQMGDGLSTVINLERGKSELEGTSPTPAQTGLCRLLSAQSDV